MPLLFSHVLSAGLTKQSTDIPVADKRRNCAHDPGALAFRGDQRKQAMHTDKAIGPRYGRLTV